MGKTDVLLPRFRIRGLLLGTAVCAVGALVLSMAVAGRPWAVGASMGLLALALWAAASAILFGLTMLLGLVSGRDDDTASPFAGDEPPPQVLRPYDPDG